MISDLEKQYLFHKHEAKRLRFFNKSEESEQHYKTSKSILFELRYGGKHKWS
ncbi:hypothetical protein HWC29_gp137 [Aeromonas phage 4_4572]|nr:hypothetical protein HWC29_gp137 [Aeromonas phage 4_4572]QEG09049.1 hypothetical protein [Aeromonas phage 4_4572]